MWSRDLSYKEPLLFVVNNANKDQACFQYLIEYTNTTLLIIV